MKFKDNVKSLLDILKILPKTSSITMIHHDTCKFQKKCCAF